MSPRYDSLYSRSRPTRNSEVCSAMTIIEIRKFQMLKLNVTGTTLGSSIRYDLTYKNRQISLAYLYLVQSAKFWNNIAYQWGRTKLHNFHTLCSGRIEPSFSFSIHSSSGYSAEDAFIRWCLSCDAVMNTNDNSFLSHLVTNQAFNFVESQLTNSISICDQGGYFITKSLTLFTQ